MGRKKVLLPAPKKRPTPKVKAPSPPPPSDDDDSSSSSSSDDNADDWEEVVGAEEEPEEVAEEPRPGPSIPPEGLVITIPRDSLFKSKARNFNFNILQSSF
jgi:hypothetical protein